MFCLRSTFRHLPQAYDLIFEAEGEMFTTMEAFHASRMMAFQQKGAFTMCVYNFRDQAYRDVVIQMPPGKPNAILGIQATPVPPPTAEQLQVGVCVCVCVCVCTCVCGSCNAASVLMFCDAGEPTGGRV